jgi:hypothetical protein
MKKEEGSQWGKGDDEIRCGKGRKLDMGSKEAGRVFCPKPSLYRLSGTRLEKWVLCK